MSINRSRSIRSRVAVTNAASLSRFTFQFNGRVDVVSVVAGSVDDILSSLLVFGVPQLS